jgi:subtilisin family serine protease
MLRTGIVVGLIVGLAGLPTPVEATDSSVPFIDAPAVHALGITGLDATVAVIDAGVDYSHPGLAGRIALDGISIVNGVRIYDGGQDVYSAGHGTYMSLIIADSTGVAPGAQVLPIRVL